MFLGDSNLSQNRIKHDRQLVKRITACGIYEVKLVRVTRMGKKIQSQDHLLLATLTDSEVRNDIFRHIKEMSKNDNLKNFRVAYDFTWREREMDRELLKKAKNLTDTGKGKHVVRDLPWNRQVVKV